MTKYSFSLRKRVETKIDTKERKMNKDIPDNIIEKAVDLWCKKLAHPSFDNGDKTEQGVIASGFVQLLINKKIDKITNMSERIENFRKILTFELVQIRDSSKEKHFMPELGVDYQPCEILARCAKKAGIPEILFSCKSWVMIHKDYVTSSFGYASDTIFYYPLPENKWLVTDMCLSNTDGRKVIESVINGNPLNLTIEK